MTKFNKMVRFTMLLLGDPFSLMTVPPNTVLEFEMMLMSMMEDGRLLLPRLDPGISLGVQGAWIECEGLCVSGQILQSPSQLRDFAVRNLAWAQSPAGWAMLTHASRDLVRSARMKMLESPFVLFQI